MAQKKIVLLISIMTVMLFARSAQAYIDPGTGSYILQMLIAGLVGGVFFLKMFWIKIKSIFLGKKKEDHLGLPKE
jgi:hypothetical protein